MLAEGLHLVWPAGAEDIVALLAADRVPASRAIPTPWRTSCWNGDSPFRSRRAAMSSGTGASHRIHSPVTGK